MIQLIYASLATQRFTMDDVGSLLASSRAKNEARGLTGMIVFHHGAFLQALEGDESVVDPLFEKICEDPRHTHVELLLRRKISSRRFPSMSFGLCNTSKADRRKYPGLFEFENVTHPFGENEDDFAHRLFLKFRNGAFHHI